MSARIRTIEDLVTCIEGILVPIRMQLGPGIGIQRHVFGSSLIEPFNVTISLVSHGRIREDEHGIDVCFSMQQASFSNPQQIRSSEHLYLLGGVYVSTGESIMKNEECRIRISDDNRIEMIIDHIASVLDSISIEREIITAKMIGFL